MARNWFVRSGRAATGRWKAFATAVAVASIPFSANAQAIDSSMLGTWILIFRGTDGAEDRVGEARLRTGENDVLLVQWQIDGRDARGVGYVRDSILWLARGWGNDPGTCIYDIGPNSITGIWSLLGSSGLSGDETWTGGKIDAEFGRWRVTGKNPDGSRYEGKLTTRRYGDVYTVQWMIGGLTYHGVGIRDGSRLVVSWCVDGSVDVARYVIDGNGWRGHSATLGRTEMREERLLRESDIGPGVGRGGR